ncbi:hypothetical protein GM418_05825 [Maribellus comscasis]|uniref:Uncharacterized protein n=1 Tax=Maribellus comscasis TaxID=2681766 RepID=A0A6I6JZW9_9BACT|nr:hypothetical protein [Maribellus comscasis]QGY43194.1 hypothetical protein GM418_05825 [Maribellus comscasis]
MKRVVAFVFMLTFSIGSFSQTNQIAANSQASDSSGFYTMKLNAVYCEDLLMYSYERLFPLDERLALALKGGFMIWDPFLPLAELALVSGGPKSFFEAGAGSIVDVFGGGGFFTMRVGYRYQGPKGFLLKGSAIYSPDNFILPLIGIGYAF